MRPLRGQKAQQCKMVQNASFKCGQEEHRSASSLKCKRKLCLELISTFLLYDALHSSLCSLQKKKIILLNLNFHTVEVDGKRKRQRPTNIRLTSRYFHNNQQSLSDQVPTFSYIDYKLTRCCTNN